MKYVPLELFIRQAPNGFEVIGHWGLHPRYLMAAEIDRNALVLDCWYIASSLFSRNFNRSATSQMSD